MDGLGGVRLLEEATWLGRGLEPTELAAARRAVVAERLRAEPGPWHWGETTPEVGLLILRGRMARSLRVDQAPADGLELLGDRDLLRPWSYEGESSSVPAVAGWTALSAVEFAVLDRRFLLAMGRWPLLAVNLLDQAVDRSRTYAFFLAVRQAPRLEARILLTLWHLADRWGRVTPEGVVVHLPHLTHEMLARMIAARRPSVTKALSTLREMGYVSTSEERTWTLHGDPARAAETIKDRIPAPDTEPVPATD